jgi:hypothetical protein
MGLGSSRNEAVPKTDCEITHLPKKLLDEEVPETDCGITHLPNELLECILLKLSYAEIAQVLQVCRRF